MGHKKSISALFSYRNGSKHPLTESESRKASICTIYNGRNCLTPCYEYPPYYYSPPFQSIGAIEKGGSSSSSNSSSNASTPSSTDMKEIKEKSSGTWKVLIFILFVTLFLGITVYLERLKIEHFFKNQFGKLHFYMA
uniref:Uncharacterized protein n=1 Tax=Strongyloides papillosus TaxID=174720 RepID=A0A0N5BMM7_STREA